MTQFVLISLKQRQLKLRIAVPPKPIKLVILVAFAVTIGIKATNERKTAPINVKVVIIFSK